MRDDSVKTYFEKDEAILQYGNCLYKGRYKYKSKK